MYLDHSVAAFGTVPIVLGAVLVAWTSYALGVALYNVAFHPLANYPGPKLQAAFYWPDAIRALRGTRAADMRKLHEKYGQVVRIAPDTLSYTNGQVWKGMSFGPMRKPGRETHRWR